VSLRGSKSARKEDDRRTPKGRRGLWLTAAGLLLAVGATASLLGAKAVRRTDVDRERLAFHLAAADITSTLKLALQHEEDLVISASAFVTGQQHMTPTAFDKWAESVRAIQRYPELQNIGLVARVTAAQLPRFEAELARHPVEPLGAHRGHPRSPFEILPPGPRPVYCFAVAGLSRSLATYIPSGLDYCALANALERARTTGQASYAPFKNGGMTTLGVQTPVYRGGLVPATEAARKRTFIGWLGELLEPSVLLQTAQAGHSHTAVTFTYAASGLHIVFHIGHQASNAMVRTIALHNGWTVRSAAPAPATGIVADPHALVLLVGGFLFSLLLGVLVLVLATGRVRALTLVREKTRELSHLALHDPLTGLPNRGLVLDRAEQMLARTARQPHVMAGALFLDVDGFKHINDNLGHAAGDQLLKTVAERLQGAVREQDTVGRLGGDEFVVLVESNSKQESADALADRLVEAVRRPVELQPGRPPVTVTASIGVAVGRYSAPDALLRDADLALYAAKAAGRDRYSLFDDTMHADAEGRVSLELDLAAALERDELFVLYQPIFDLSRRRVEGVEALVRWRHPLRGVLAPGEFIPLAEESGLIVPIGRWVLEQACNQAADWARAGRPIGMSVNVSAFQLGREDFAGEVREALSRSGLDPSLLLLEITETTVMRDVQAACVRLGEVKALGVNVALDDFGTGYASLSHLQRIPADILKIDRSFVAALEEGEQSAELLQAILGVARSLSLRVVVEGIETDEQLGAVSSMGCEMAQGFLLGRPTPAEVIDGLLALKAESSRGHRTPAC
jgi:diguanylate cyclase (GGDEF)-like protein